MNPCDSLLAFLENNLRLSKRYINVIDDFEIILKSTRIDIGSGPSSEKTIGMKIDFGQTIIPKEQQAAGFGQYNWWYLYYGIQKTKIQKNYKNKIINNNNTDISK